MKGGEDTLETLRARVRELEAKIAELTAERDRLRRWVAKQTDEPRPFPREWSLEGNRSDPALRE